jgi:DNA-binding Lrp family transcriptional regulator
LVRAIILVKSPKKLIAARLRRVDSVKDSFPTSGQFDAIAIIEVDELGKIKDIATQIQKISGVDRTETMVEVQ